MLLSDLSLLNVVEAVGLPFGQTAEVADFAVIGLLIVLEGVLSIDNALVLGLLARKVPKHLQKKALTYGLIGAFVFRIIAIGTATLLMKWWIVKLLGGGYLVYVAGKHLLFEERSSEHAGEKEGAEAAAGLLPEDEARTIDRAHARQFWMTVLAIELTDIAFAVDSILAAIALVANQSKTWVVVTGGMLGVILMRFAAIVFIKLLEKFPRFEMAAYLLVLVIGGKLLVDWGFNSPTEHVVSFHEPGSVAFWVFWALMLVCFLVGFLPQKKAAKSHQPA